MGTKAISLPLQGDLNGTNIGAGTFNRATIAYYFDGNNVLQQAAIDAPRFTGKGLLIEAAGSNVCLQSRDFTVSPWQEGFSPNPVMDSVGIDGVANSACTVTDASAATASLVYQVVTIPDDSNQNTGSVFIKKDNDETRFPEVHMSQTGGTATQYGVHVNTKTGATAEREDVGTNSHTIEDWGDWWRVILTTTNNGTGNTLLDLKVRPAGGTSIGVHSNTAVGSVVIDQAQVELNQAFASSPIITGALGADLVTNGDFATDTDWAKEDPAWTIAAGVASCDGSQAGNASISRTGDLPDTGNVLYQVSLDVTRSAGTWQVFLGNNGWQHEVSYTDLTSDAGSFVFYLQSSPDGTQNGRIYFNGNADFVGTLDNVVVKEVTGGARATEAGVADTSGAQWTLNTALTNMLVETLGSDLVTDGTFDTLGSDLVTNGGFDADTDWNKGTGWSIAAGVADCDGTQPGDSGLIQVSATGGTSGDWYKITFDLTRSAGSVKVWLGTDGWDYTTSTTGEISSGGSYVYYLQVPPAGADTTSIRIRANSTFVGTVDNVTAEEIGADWTWGDGWNPDGSVADCDGTQAAASNLLQENVTTGTSGDLHKVTFDLTRSAGNILGVWLGAEGYLNSTSTSGNIATGGSYVFYLTVPPTGSNKHRLYVRADDSFVGTVDNVVVKKVTNDSRGTMVVDWTPGVDTDGATGAEGLVTSNQAAQQSLLYTNESQGKLITYDGTIFPYTLINWSGRTTYRVAVRWGVDTSNVREFGLSIQIAGSWTHGTKQDYDGAFSIDTYLLLSKANTRPQHFKNITFYSGEPLTDGELLTYGNPSGLGFQARWF
jgi:hypothetical protein